MLHKKSRVPLLHQIVKGSLILTLSFLSNLSFSQVNSCRELDPPAPFKWGLFKEQALQLSESLNINQTVDELFDPKKIAITLHKADSKYSVVLGFYTRSNQLNETAEIYQVSYDKGLEMFNRLKTQFSKYGDPLHIDTFEGYALPARGHTMKRHKWELAGSAYLIVDEDTAVQKSTNSTLIVRRGCGFKEYTVKPQFPDTL